MTLEEALQEIDRLNQWVADLQSHQTVNCVYCGHRYGPDPGTPVAMADVLRDHIEQCPKHPVSRMKAALERIRTVAVTALPPSGFLSHDDAGMFFVKIRHEVDAALQR